MAEKRMFSKKITESDPFLDMSQSAQNLYFHLAMNADDDGFVDKPKGVMRLVGGSSDDLRLLISKQFLIPFDSGVIVIKHWRLHNYIRSDRYKPTIHQEEKALLDAEQDGTYTLGMSTGIPTVDKMDTQYRLDKIKLNKTSIDKGESVRGGKDNPDTSKPKKKKKPNRHRYGEYKNVLLSDRELEILKRDVPNWQDWIEQLSVYMQSTGKHYKDHLATIKNWIRKRENEPQSGTTTADSGKWATGNEPSVAEIIANM